MAEFTIEPQPLIDEKPNTEKRFKNVKEIKAGDGSFEIYEGKLVLRDSAGNIVVLLDANG